MTRHTEPVSIEQSGHDRQTLTHPSFGLISVSEINGRSAMFGSELIHDRVVRIRVTHAAQDRNLSNDWNFERGRILELDMTHAQFAQFIGCHSGRTVPVTLRSIRDGQLEQVPEIDMASQPPKIEQFRKEMQATVNRVAERSSSAFSKLDEALDEAKIPQKLRAQLKALTTQAQGSLSALPSALSFILEQAHEASEAVVNDAKVGLESYALRRMAEVSTASLDGRGTLNDELPILTTSGQQEVLRSISS